MSAERLKALEIQQEYAADDMAEIKLDISTIREQVTEINRKMDSQRGYIAGVMSVVALIWSGVVAVIAVAWETIVSAMKDMWL